MNWNPQQALETQALAAAWLVQLDAGASPESLAQWRQWINADAHHRAAYLRLEASWLHADCLKNLQPLDGTVDLNVLDTFPGLGTRPTAELRREGSATNCTAG